MGARQSDAPPGQNDLVLAHLRSGLPLTGDEALARYGVRRLAARVHDLRARGIAITSRKIDGRAEYQLAE
ncbi:helix-turn-helix domain-containing protein [Pararhodospirillum oryzae]|uniref:Winged helix-turn-helix domain-containing protein n=1 Tax=Pararhodospirillum oryzae TaxID=478448 RepID=A0A512HC79_9PROT|nr:helix-turn-helix domain-containing protein [Pararhodospirillum oryzae]GEO83058.1 hypothetical protein ROR02_31890 [Pararhodospirillum oryzae]